MSATGGVIESVECAIVQIPYKNVQVDGRKTHGYTIESVTNLLVCVRDRTGHEGWGEVRVPPFQEKFQPPKVTAIIGEVLAPSVVGTELGNFSLLHSKMDSAIGGYQRLKAAIEAAAYDLLGKALGVPVWKILGGKIVDAIPVLGWVGAPTGEECSKKAIAYVEAGFDTLKVKVGFGPNKDEEIVRAVRGAVGEKVLLRVDANSVYTRDEALESLRRLQPYNIYHYEDPIPIDDIEGMAWLRQKVPVRLMADASCVTAADLIRVIRAQAADIVKLSFQVNGGIYKTAQMLRIAEAAGMPATLGHSSSLTIGVLAEVHLGASAPNLLSPCEFVGLLKCVDDVVRTPLDLTKVKVSVPDSPGLGVDVDPDKIRKYRLSAP